MTIRPFYIPAEFNDERDYMKVIYEVHAYNKAVRLARVAAGESPTDGGLRKIDDALTEAKWSFVPHVRIPMKVGRGTKVHAGHARAWINPKTGGWVVVGAHVDCGSRRHGSSAYGISREYPIFNDADWERVTCGKCNPSK